MKPSLTQKQSPSETSKSSNKLIPMICGKKTLFYFEPTEATIYVGMVIPYPDRRSEYNIEKIENDFILLKKSPLNYAPEVYSCINCNVLISLDHFDDVNSEISKKISLVDVNTKEYDIAEAFINMGFENGYKFVCSDCFNKIINEENKCLAKTLNLI